MTSPLSRATILRPLLLTVLRYTVVAYMNLSSRAFQYLGSVNKKDVGCSQETQVYGSHSTFHALSLEMKLTYLSNQAELMRWLELEIRVPSLHLHSGRGSVWNEEKSISIVIGDELIEQKLTTVSVASPATRTVDRAKQKRKAYQVYLIKEEVKFNMFKEASVGPTALPSNRKEVGSKRAGHGVTSWEASRQASHGKLRLIYNRIELPMYLYYLFFISAEARRTMWLCQADEVACLQGHHRRSLRICNNNTPLMFSQCNAWLQCGQHMRFESTD